MGNFENKWQEIRNAEYNFLFKENLNINSELKKEYLNNEFLNIESINTALNKEYTENNKFNVLKKYVIRVNRLLSKYYLNDEKYLHILNNIDYEKLDKEQILRNRLFYFAAFNDENPLIIDFLKKEDFYLIKKDENFNINSIFKYKLNYKQLDLLYQIGAIAPTKIQNFLDKIYDEVKNNISSNIYENNQVYQEKFNQLISIWSKINQLEKNNNRENLNKYLLEISKNFSIDYLKLKNSTIIPFFYENYKNGLNLTLLNNNLKHNLYFIKDYAKYYYENNNKEIISLFSNINCHFENEKNNQSINLIEKDKYLTCLDTLLTLDRKNTIKNFNNYLYFLNQEILENNISLTDNAKSVLDKLKVENNINFLLDKLSNLYAEQLNCDIFDDKVINELQKFLNYDKSNLKNKNILAKTEYQEKLIKERFDNLIKDLNITNPNLIEFIDKYTDLKENLLLNRFNTNKDNLKFLLININKPENKLNYLNFDDLNNNYYFIEKVIPFLTSQELLSNYKFLKYFIKNVEDMSIFINKDENKMENRYISMLGNFYLGNLKDIDKDNIKIKFNYKNIYQSILNSSKLQNNLLNDNELFEQYILKYYYFLNDNTKKENYSKIQNNLLNFIQNKIFTNYEIYLNDILDIKNTINILKDINKFQSKNNNFDEKFILSDIKRNYILTNYKDNLNYLKDNVKILNEFLEKTNGRGFFLLTDDLKNNKEIIWESFKNLNQSGYDLFFKEIDFNLLDNKIIQKMLNKNISIEQYMPPHILKEHKTLIKNIYAYSKKEDVKYHFIDKKLKELNLDFGMNQSHYLTTKQSLKSFFKFK